MPETKEIAIEVVQVMVGNSWHRVVAGTYQTLEDGSLTWEDPASGDRIIASFPVQAIQCKEIPPEGGDA